MNLVGLTLVIINFDTLSLDGSSPSLKDLNMGSKTSSWSDQWGTGVFDNEEKENEKKENTKSNNNNNKKMEQVKAVAATGLVKAKSAAIVGAHKVKKEQPT
ncbi:unnamed protein product [Lactuca virosa]|uniref:Uncharacterized protein n=1 Tax=Lactuca virosa TaxID=75947 RepID=A0AAU9PJL0_9ASTR|nr:unnamed protein product [Lactuca virosa]